MKAEIGWNEAAPFLREFAVKIKAGFDRQFSRRRGPIRELRRQRMLKEIKKFLIGRDCRLEVRQTLTDLAHNLSAGQACFRREWLQSGVRTSAQTMNCTEETDGGIDVVIGDFDDVAAVNPAQQRVTALIVYAEYTGHPIDVMAFKKPERADFSRKSVAGIVIPRRILLQRENAGAAPHPPDAAVTATADDPGQLDRAADEGARDVGRLG
jgi:hypothetical protein